MKKLFIAMSALIISAPAFSQLTIPRPSPTQKLEQEFGTSKITIEYSRPSVKGRIIFGDLVPWGQPWRTGANASTKIIFATDVQVQGKNVPAGKYALYTIPNKDEWTIMLSRDSLLWGAEGYKTDNEQLRFTVKPTANTQSIETFTINLFNIKRNSCEIGLWWDKTMVSFSVTEEIDPKIMAQITEAMKSDKPPYGQAATYYFDNGKDINQAYAWINKAIEERPEAYWHMTTKAKIEMKMGKNKEAIATAEKAKELALKDNDNSYVQQNEKLIADVKSMQ